MKTPDSKGKRTRDVLNLPTYERIREADEELADLKTYDAARHQAHSEIAAGQFSTLSAYRTSRGRKTNEHTI